MISRALMNDQKSNRRELDKLTEERYAYCRRHLARFK